MASLSIKLTLHLYSTYNLHKSIDISAFVITVIILNVYKPVDFKTIYLGRDKSPLVIIDGFSNAVELIISAGLQANYKPAGAAYPGLRAAANPNYLKLHDALMFQIFQETFNLSKHIAVENAAYSLVTTPRTELKDYQCIPHIDDTNSNLLAIMHFLRGPETGGTAFYRHKRTGFETITAERYDSYKRALAEDEAAYGPPVKDYIHGDTNRFEMIENIEARPDRLVIYRGHALHSGYITPMTHLSSDPAKGRLTVNMFLKGH